MIMVSEQLNSQMVMASLDVTTRAVCWCAEKYGFDAKEALQHLNLREISLERKQPARKKQEVTPLKSQIPLPYSGHDFGNEYCRALRKNAGLYTQCTSTRPDGKDYCNGCQKLSEKSADGIPEYGTIAQRMSVGILEYVDPSGKKPVAYGIIMNKLNLTQEQVNEEAAKLNIVVDMCHFEPVTAAKRGRRSQKEKVVKPNSGVKGRPKKAKTTVQLEEQVDDLFASIVAEVASESEDESDLEELEVSQEELVITQKEEKKAEKQEREDMKMAEKESKVVERSHKKESKKAETDAKKAAKEAKKAAAEEKAAKKAAKEAKKAAAEEKATKKEKPATKNELKAPKNAGAKEKSDITAINTDIKTTFTKTQESREEEEEEESDEEEEEEEEESDEEEEETTKICTVKFDYKGTSYLKSKDTGIVYHLKTHNVMGKWNDKTQQIDFSSEEEEEEEYDEDEQDD